MASTEDNKSSDEIIKELFSSLNVQPPSPGSPPAKSETLIHPLEEIAGTVAQSRLNGNTSIATKRIQAKNKSEIVSGSSLTLGFSKTKPVNVADLDTSHSYADSDITIIQEHLVGKVVKPVVANSALLQKLLLADTSATLQTRKDKPSISSVAKKKRKHSPDGKNKSHKKKHKKSDVKSPHTRQLADKKSTSPHRKRGRSVSHEKQQNDKHCRSSSTEKKQGKKFRTKEQTLSTSRSDQRSRSNSKKKWSANSHSKSKERKISPFVARSRNETSSRRHYRSRSPVRDGLLKFSSKKLSRSPEHIKKDPFDVWKCKMKQIPEVSIIESNGNSSHMKGNSTNLCIDLEEKSKNNSEPLEICAIPMPDQFENLAPLDEIPLPEETPIRYSNTDVASLDNISLPSKLPGFDCQDGTALHLASFDIPLPPTPPSGVPAKAEYISTYPPPNPSKLKRRSSLKTNLNIMKESTFDKSTSIISTQPALTCSVSTPSGKAEITVPNGSENCCSQSIIHTHSEISSAATLLMDNNSSASQTTSFLQTALINSLASQNAGHHSCSSSPAFVYSNRPDEPEKPCSSFVKKTTNAENVVSIEKTETVCKQSAEKCLQSISYHHNTNQYSVNPEDKKMFHPSLPKSSSAIVEFSIRPPNQNSPNNMESRENQLIRSVPSNSGQNIYPSNNSCLSSNDSSFPQISSLTRNSVTNNSTIGNAVQCALTSPLPNYSLMNQLQMTSLPPSLATSNPLPNVINDSLPSGALPATNIPPPNYAGLPSTHINQPLTMSPTILHPSTCSAKSTFNILPVSNDGPAQNSFTPPQATTTNTTNSLQPSIASGIITTHTPTLNSTTTTTGFPSSTHTTTDLSMIASTMQPPPFGNTTNAQQQVTTTTTIQLPSLAATTTTTTGVPPPVNIAGAAPPLPPPPPPITITGAPPPPTTASSPPARSCPTAGGATASGVSVKGRGRTGQAATTVSGTAVAGDRSKGKSAGSIRIASLKDSALFLAATEISLKNKERERVENAEDDSEEMPAQPNEEEEGLPSNVNTTELEIEECDKEKHSRKHKKDKKNKKDKEKEASSPKKRLNKEEKDKHNKEKKKKSSKRRSPSHSSERHGSHSPSKSKTIRSHDKSDRSRERSVSRDKSSKHEHRKSRSQRSKSRERSISKEKRSTFNQRKSTSRERKSKSRERKSKSRERKSKSKERKNKSKEKRRSRSKEKRRSQSVGKTSSRKSSERSRRETSKEKQGSSKDDRTSKKSNRKSDDFSDKKSSRRRSHSSERRRRSRSPSKHSKSRYNKSPSRTKKRSSGGEDDCVKALKDKVTRKRLLEIAKRNAVQMVTSGQLPATYGPVAGGAVPGMYPVQGKSVDDLTAFCKQLAAMGEYSDDEDGRGVLVDENGDSDSGGNEPSKETFSYAGKHPFAVRDRSIMMNIRNAPMLPIKSNAERLVETSKLREQFPVSSGSHHRDKDKEWVPVEPGDGKLKAITAGPSSASEGGESSPAPESDTRPPDPDKVFAEPEESAINIDLSEIVSERLSAMRRLQENPDDPDAKSQLSTVQKTMSNWALSKQEPGKFTGNTGVKVLSIEELSSGQQAWARKEQLKTAAPVSSHFGLRMLQKMGWNPGEGLGKNKEGSTIPLMLEVKTDKKGFHAQEELTPQKPPIPLAKTLAGEVSRRGLAAAVHQQAIENPIVRFVRTELNAALQQQQQQLQQSAFPANTGSARGGRGGGGGGRGRGGGAGGVNRNGGGGNNRGGGGANLAPSGRGGSAGSVAAPRSSSSCGAEDGGEGGDANISPSLAGAGSSRGGGNSGAGGMNSGVGFAGANSANARFSSRGGRGGNDGRGNFNKNNSGRGGDQTGSIGGGCGGMSFSSFSASPGPFNLGNTNNLGSLPGLPNDTLPGLLNFLTSLNSGHDLSPLQLAQLRAISQLSGVQATPANSSISALTSALYGLAGLANQQQAGSSGLLGGRGATGGHRGRGGAAPRLADNFGSASGGSGTIQPLMSLNLLQQQPQPFRVTVNNQEYKPSQSAPTKKLAKANAAAACLMSLGIPSMFPSVSQDAVVPAPPVTGGPGASSSGGGGPIVALPHFVNGGGNAFPVNNHQGQGQAFTFNSNASNSGINNSGYDNSVTSNVVGEFEHPLPVHYPQAQMQHQYQSGLFPQQADSVGQQFQQFLERFPQQDVTPTYVPDANRPNVFIAVSHHNAYQGNSSGSVFRPPLPHRPPQHHCLPQPHRPPHPQPHGPASATHQPANGSDGPAAFPPPGANLESFPPPGTRLQSFPPPGGAVSCTISPLASKFSAAPPPPPPPLPSLDGARQQTPTLLVPESAPSPLPKAPARSPFPGKPSKTTKNFASVLKKMPATTIAPGGIRSHTTTATVARNGQTATPVVNTISASVATIAPTAATSAPPVPPVATPAPSVAPTAPIAASPALIAASSAPTAAPPSPIAAPPSPIAAPPSPIAAPPSPIAAPPALTAAPRAPTAAPPAPTAAPPAPTAAPPAPTAAPPAPTAAPPAPTAAPPAPTAAPPAPTAAPPAPTAAPPAPTAAPPAPTAAPPAPTAAPPAPTAAPPAPTAAPPAPTAAPPAPTAAPPAPTAAPPAPTAAPPAPTAAPPAPTAAPPAPTAAPPAPTTAPPAPTTAPPAPTMAPPAPTTAPPAPTTAPPAPTTAPPTPTTTPPALGSVIKDFICEPLTLLDNEPPSKKIKLDAS